MEDITELVRSRASSLEMTQIARVGLLEEQRDNASDVRIRRMRESQIETAKLDYDRRVQELTLAAQRVDIIAEAVAFGVLVVKGE